LQELAAWKAVSFLPRRFSTLKHENFVAYSPILLYTFLRKMSIRKMHKV
jgi:hypothetical protein